MPLTEHCRMWNPGKEKWSQKCEQQCWAIHNGKHPVANGHWFCDSDKLGIFYKWNLKMGKNIKLNNFKVYVFQGG